MSAIQIRQRLFDYIRFADERKIKAFYTIVEGEIKENEEIWNDAFIKEMHQRAKEIESGKIPGKSRREVSAKALSLLKR